MIELSVKPTEGKRYSATLQAECFLDPYGITEKREHLGRITITNDGTGTQTKGNYTYTLSPQGNPERVWKRGRITNFPRSRKNIHYLLKQVLEEALT